MGYGTRTPTSNEAQREKSNPWIEENDCMDEIALLLCGAAKRCRQCRRACRTRHLQDGLCPDCRSTSNTGSHRPSEPEASEGSVGPR